MKEQFGANWPLLTNALYSIVEFEKLRSYIEAGDPFRCKGKITSKDSVPATVYLIVRFVNPYNRNHIIFDSDRDFTHNKKLVLKFEVEPNSTREFSLVLPVDELLSGQVVDIQLELWSPGRLFHDLAPLQTIGLFYREWVSSFEVRAVEDYITTVFISYAWGQKAHMDWVNLLSQELSRHGIKTILDKKRFPAGKEMSAFGTEFSKCPGMYMYLFRTLPGQSRSTQGGQRRNCV
jgi:hypothetical protein